MKINTLVKVVAISLLVMFGFVLSKNTKSVEAQSASNPGRFQLLEGTYTINARGNSLRETNVLRIDTQTGTTWIYREGMTTGGTLFSKWDKISE